MMIYVCPKHYNRVIIFVTYFIFQIYDAAQNTVVGNLAVDLVCIMNRTLKYNSRYLGEIRNN